MQEEEGIDRGTLADTAPGSYNWETMKVCNLYFESGDSKRPMLSLMQLDSRKKKDHLVLQPGIWSIFATRSVTILFSDTQWVFNVEG